MANLKQAKKRVRQNETHRRLNTSMRSMLRTYIKKVHTAITAGDQKEATASFQAATPIIDRMASKGIIHKNKAARQKAALSAQAKAAGAKPAKAAAKPAAKTAAKSKPPAKKSVTRKTTAKKASK